jgi:hypothetical protein
MLLRCLPLLGLGLIAIGLIDSVLYYSKFDINIVSYLDASEIIFFPADRIIVIGSVFTTLVVGLIPIIRKIDDHLQSLHPTRVFYYKFFAVCLLVMLEIFIKDETFNELQYDVLHVLIYSINFSIISSALSSLKLSRDNIIIFGFFFAAFSFFNGRVSTKNTNIEKYGAKYSVQLTLSSGDEISSSKSFVFIGRTKNYYFFRWLKPLNKTIIIPTSSVRQERISRLRDNI